MEIEILDFIQTLRTAFGDWFFPLVTKLGNAGIIWIILAVILLIIPKTRKYGAIVGIISGYIGYFVVKKFEKR